MSVQFPYPSENISGMSDLVTYGNSLTEGFLGTAIVIVVFIITFIASKNYSNREAFGFAGFITFIIAVLLRFMSLINDNTLYIVIISFIGIVIWMWFAKQEESL